jgi:Xaa-Pro dipeptidase
VMNAACRDAILACQEQLRPGRTVGEVYDTHQRSFEKSGWGHATLSACGYTMGAMYPPTWMDWPMFWTGHPQVIEAGMVFFLHMILFDKDAGLTMCVGETAIVTEGDCERVNHVPDGLILK